MTLLERAKAVERIKHGPKTSRTVDDFTAALAYVSGEITSSQLGTALGIKPSWVQQWAHSTIAVGIRNGAISATLNQEFGKASE